MAERQRQVATWDILYIARVIAVRFELSEGTFIWGEPDLLIFFVRCGYLLSD